MNMDDFICPVCLGYFDHKELFPKVLECGHSLCSKCLSKIQLSTAAASCPTCRHKFPQKKSFPTNYSLLNLLTQWKKVLEGQEGEAAVADLKRKATKLLNEVKEEMTTSCKRTRFLESTLSRVVKLQKFEENNISVKRALCDMSDIRKDIVIEEVKLESFETLNMTDFKDDDEYLYEVYRKMKNWTMFAIHPVGKEYKYGEITFLGNKIFVHCLSSLPEKPRNATYVLFQDLKRCWMKLKFGTFLQIPCNAAGLKALVEIEVNKVELTNEYLKLCTGEIGPTYKGASYEKIDRKNKDGRLHHFLSIDKYICDGHLKTGQIDYRSTKISTSLKDGEIVCLQTDDLKFYITKVVSDVACCAPYINIIGKVVSPSNLANFISSSSEFSKKIEDCGIYFNLE